MGIFDRALQARGADPPVLEQPKAFTPLLEKLKGAAKVRNQQEYPEVYGEMQRIVELPVRRNLSPASFEEFNRRHVLVDPFREGWRLWPVQANALSEFEKWGSGFFPIGVGWGKTLITLMISNHAWAEGTRKIMLMIPPNVYAQLTTVDLQWARTRVPITYPVHGLHLGTKGRMQLAKSGKPGLYIMPFSLLSTKDSHDVLHAIDPDLVLLDEAHYLKRRTAARTKRFLHFIEDRFQKERPVRLVCLSGTITSKSIMDYHHLIRACQAERSPVPISPSMAADWASVLDTGSFVTRGSTPLQPLLDWARRNFPEESERLAWGTPGFRHAFSMRLNSTPGIVGTGDAEVGSSLIITTRQVALEGDGADRLKELQRKIIDEWTTPNGDEIEHAIHTYKWLFELSAGFYNELYWPDAEWLVRHGKASSLEQAAELLDRALAHHALQQTFAKTLRNWLEATHIPKLDTPLLVTANMAKNGANYVGRELFEAWSSMKDAEFEGMPERLSRVVRICDYKIKAAIRWATEHRTGIIWYHNQGIGEWLNEALRAAGIAILYCPAGDEHNARIIDKKHRSKVIVASMAAHGTGKNLQHFDRSFFLQWPRPATTAEQVLGRTHRQGQESDEVIADRLVGCMFDDLLFAATVTDSCYIHQSTGARQKLLYAGYDPLPPIFPDEALTEWGFENRRLDRTQRDLLKNKFGEFARTSNQNQN